MKKKDHNEIFKEGDTVFCINESAYSQHITKRKEYQITQIGTGTKSGKIRIKGNLNRFVYISDMHFSKTNQAAIKNINIDDKIDEPLNDCIEITVTFKNEKKAWFTVMTPKYLMKLLSSHNPHFSGNNVVFLPKISEEKIKTGKYKRCLEFHLGNCKAPCEDLQKSHEYHKQIDDIRDIIKGNFKSSLLYFKHQMKALASEMEFEKAQRIKEKIEVLENYQV